MTFRIGQKVVCIDDTPLVSVKRSGRLSFLRPWTKLDHNLNRGDVYTITGIREAMDEVSRIRIATCYVDGARHFMPAHVYPHDPGFPTFQFRPLVTKKTDIAVFTSMLNKSPERVT